MNTALTIAVHEFKMMYRRRVFQIITVGVPVVVSVGLLVAWVVQNVGDDSGEADKAGYVDGTALFSGHLLQDGVEFVRYDSPDEGMSALLEEDIEKFYIIPPDYLATWLIHRVEVGFGFSLDDGRDRRLSRFLLENLSDIAPESDVTERLMEPVLLTTLAVDPEGVPRELEGSRVFFFLGLAFLLMFSLAMTGGFLLQGLGEEKEGRVIEVLLSSVTPVQFMAGKVLGLSGAGLSQVLIWVVAGRVLLAVLPSVFPDLELALPGLALTAGALVFFVLEYLMFATLNAGLGAISPTARESQQLTILVAAPLIVPIYAWVYIVENPIAGIVRFLTFFPLTSPLVVLERLGPESIEAWEIALSLTLSSLAVVFTIFLVSRIFRAFLLSYGQRPSWRLVLRVLVRG
jgi:ABC-2 type transport system permease protein